MRYRCQAEQSVLCRITCNVTIFNAIFIYPILIKFCGFLLGMFFIIPCIDSYQKVDLRVVSFDVPPQEVTRI